MGALVVNYFGHGGEDGLAAERIFDKINAQELNNPSKLNCFVTVTCEYTKFDNPLRETAGEYLFWNKKGGAISLITTTRQIYIFLALTFNKTLSQYLFSYGSDETSVLVKHSDARKTTLRSQVNLSVDWYFTSETLPLNSPSQTQISELLK